MLVNHNDFITTSTKKILIALFPNIFQSHFEDMGANCF